MINLLPPEIREENLLERKKRVVLLNWVLLLLFLGLLSLAMFSTKFYIEEQTTSLKTLSENNKQTLERNLQKEMLNEIGSFNLFFEKLNNFYKHKVYISEILDKISAILPDQIYFNNFSVSSDLVLENESDELQKAVGFEIYISGFSPTREELLQFKTRVEREKDFKGVSFPLTNWVKPTDVDFSLNFKVIKP